MTTPTQDPMEAAQPWHGQLYLLLPVLTREAEQRAGQWAMRRMTHGAVVALRVLDGRRVLQLHRPLGPMQDTEKRDRLWAQEVQTFLKHFRALEWEPTDPVPLTTRSVLTVAFMEPAAA